MPCMCHYEPSEESKKLIKRCCVEIVNEIKDCEKIGDPLGLSLNDVKILLDHLYKEECPENTKERMRI